MKTETGTQKHLWEIDHPYYCSESNYFKPGNSGTETVSHYKSWGDFFEDYKEADLDMNLLFRFDWEGENADGEKLDYLKDPYYRSGKLKLFFFMQRKGYHQTKIIEVCAADEPAVLQFLAERWQHMRALWEGVSGWEPIVLQNQGATNENG